MTEMKILQAPDYVILLSYFAILIFIGVYFRRCIREAKDYFAAGAAVPWWLSGVYLAVNLAVGGLMFLSGFLLRVLKIGKPSAANS